MGGAHSSCTALEAKMLHLQLHFTQENDHAHALPETGVDLQRLALGHFR